MKYRTSLRRQEVTRELQDTDFPFWFEGTLFDKSSALIVITLHYMDELKKVGAVSGGRFVSTKRGRKLVAMLDEYGYDVPERYLHLGCDMLMLAEGGDA